MECILPGTVHQEDALAFMETSDDFFQIFLRIDDRGDLVRGRGTLDLVDNRLDGFLLQHRELRLILETGNVIFLRDSECDIALRKVMFDNLREPPCRQLAWRGNENRYVVPVNFIHPGISPRIALRVSSFCQSVFYIGWHS